MARRRTFNWPADRQQRQLIRAMLAESVARYARDVGEDGRIRLGDVIENCVATSEFLLRLDPDTPKYRLDVDEKSLRGFVADQMRQTLTKLGGNIKDPDPEVRRNAYVWVPDFPEQQLSGGFYRRLRALDDDELQRYHERNMKLRVAYEMRELAAELEAKTRDVALDDRVKVMA